MSSIASQITSPRIVFSTVYLDTDQRKHQSSASLAFVQGIHRKPVNSPHKWPVTRKMFPFDDVIMDLVMDLVMDVVRTWLLSITPFFQNWKRSCWARNMTMTGSYCWLRRNSAWNAVQPSTSRLKMHYWGGWSIMVSVKETMLNQISFNPSSVLFFILMPNTYWKPLVVVSFLMLVI